MADQVDIPAPSNSGSRFGLVGMLERLAEIGARPDDSHDERLREGALILAAVLVVFLSFVWVITYASRGLYVSAAIPGSYQVLTLLGLIVLLRTKRFDVFRTTQLTLFLVLPALLQASLGGFVASSGMVLWSMITPLAALAMLGLRRSVPWLVGFFLVVALLALAEPRLAGNPAGLPSGVVTLFFVLNLTGVMLCTFVMLGYFVYQRELAHHALVAESERSERLLLNVLPAPIADRLKHHEGVIAERYEEVTVLFGDLVGFTKLSSGLDASEVVGLLDEIFTAFDEIVEAEGLEKIKTIGDAYMVAGGLPVPRPDHVQAVARAALGMRAQVEAIASRRIELGTIAIRIGIDTGPAVAGVIGRRKFIYDLWGDTVNTASRMESHGLPGEIQVTSRVAECLAGAFELRERGPVEIKGKGTMDTFLLVGPSG